MQYKPLCSLLLVALSLALVPTALASNTWYVDGVNGNDNNSCKSRHHACKTIGHAISLALSGDSIMIAPATYKENLTIGIGLKLIGSGAPTTIIDGQALSCVIYIPVADASVSLSRVTIRNGYDSVGGGIYNLSSVLTIDNSTINHNLAAGEYDDYGGGIYNYHGTVTINNSTISRNSVQGGGYPGFGGGICNDAGGTVTINNSIVSGNSGGFGGGVQSGGTLIIKNSTFTGNSATVWGGGLGSGGATWINNSTISGNSAPQGTGGGLFLGYGGTVTLQNSIVANNPSGGDCHGGPSSNGYNLSSDNTCNLNGRGDHNNTNPKLGKLGYHGGPTQTFPLLSGSPAIDAGNPNGCTDGQGHLLKTDQRGKPRPDKEDKTGCDMGAFERQSD